MYAVTTNLPRAVRSPCWEYLPMMTLGTPLFAQGLGIPDLGLLLVKLLAVVGGAAVGGIGGGGLSRLFCRFVVRRQAPKPVVKLVRLLGAALLGLAVWFWVF